MAEPDKRPVTMEGWFASSLSAWSSWTRNRLLLAVRLNWGVLLLRTVSIMMLCAPSDLSLGSVATTRQVMNYASTKAG